MEEAEQMMAKRGFFFCPRGEMSEAECGRAEKLRRRPLPGANFILHLVLSSSWRHAA